MGILAIDVGTTSMRGVLYDHHGLLLGIHRVSYENIHIGSRQVEQDANVWEQGLVQILKEIQIVSSDLKVPISAISLTCQRSSVIPIDEHGNALANAIMWQDTRTKEMCQEFTTYDEEIYSICGAKVNTVFSALKILWYKRYSNDIYTQASKLVGIADFLVYKMTKQLCTDYTYGSRTLLMNLKTKCWDTRLLEVFGLDREKLCDLIEPGTIVGGLCRKMALLTGLSEGIPIVSAGGDQQCAIIGKGVVESGDLSITTGTGAFLIALCDEIPSGISNDIICNVAAIPGKYIVEMNTLACTAGFDWFLKNFYDMKNMTYEDVFKLLESVRWADKQCLVLPCFQGKSAPDANPLATALFANINLGTTREDLLCALLEGICFEIKEKIDIMSAQFDISNIYLGGGLSKSDIFNQIQTDIYAQKTYRYSFSEETSVGALISAMCALGCSNNIQQALQMVSVGQQLDSYIPDKSREKIYKNMMKAQQKLYERNK